uniref:Uncharacterized protein n=1 Tax=Oryza brachyantha TaxID=4533 RepID=J3MRL6_ORYBR
MGRAGPSTARPKSHFPFFPSPRATPTDLSGAGVFGHLSDAFLERKGSLQVVCVLNGVFSVLTAFAPNCWAYAELRLLTGFSAGRAGLYSFVLATEPVSPARRGDVHLLLLIRHRDAVPVVVEDGRSTWFRLVLSVVINLLPSVVYYGLSLNVINLMTNLYIISVLMHNAMDVPPENTEEEG